MNKEEIMTYFYGIILFAVGWSGKLADGELAIAERALRKVLCFPRTPCVLHRRLARNGSCLRDQNVDVAERGWTKWTPYQGYSIWIGGCAISPKRWSQKSDQKTHEFSQFDHESSQFERFFKALSTPTMAKFKSPSKNRSNWLDSPQI